MTLPTQIENQLEYPDDRTCGEFNERNEFKVVKRKTLIEQPSCARSNMLLILKEICADLMIKHELCTPEDVLNSEKHKIPIYTSKKKLNKEAEVPTIINYALGGILITSLGASLLELYRAKKKPAKKDGKNPLSRKCSLADLTVLKHQRKELLRRDSLMEVPEETLYSRQLGRKVSRSPMRLD
ncbi:hypothetical protein JTB14_035305 [Gonioctena quinquepunctata]|nr:hypothetical protein JTB14_035305 [Gonioctena quinquepunctata]